MGNEEIRKIDEYSFNLGKEAMLDRVCEWLVDNIYGYVEESQKYSDGYSIDLSSLVSDLRGIRYGI